MTTSLTRAERPYDPADLSSHEFWASTAKDREKTFAELQGHLTNEQMVDLTVTAAFYCAVVRTLASLAIDVEPEYQPYLDRFPLPA